MRRPTRVRRHRHDLRHSFASRALALGESLPMIGKFLGHTQVQTTARYAHLDRARPRPPCGEPTSTAQTMLYTD